MRARLPNWRTMLKSLRAAISTIALWPSCNLDLAVSMWQLYSRFPVYPTISIMNPPMTTSPLTSNDHGKLFVFALLILPAAAFLVGAIPFLFILFGLFMLRRTNDFSHIETAARNFKIYCWLLIPGFLFAAWGQRGRLEDIVGLSMCAGISGAYILALNFFFLNPLRRHREWIQQNGIFSNRSKEESPDADVASIDIIKGERLRSFSVADELLKWAKLKEDGHISEQEFNEARAKLLQKS